MELLDKKLKEYIASISVPDEIKPSQIKKYIEDNGEITAGKFLKKLREMKISGSEFLELLGNSKIGNIEFRRIEENPHLRFDELLQILDGSNLGDEDYRTMLSVATGRRQQSEERRRREEETLRRVSLEEKGYVQEPNPVVTEKKSETVITEAPPVEKIIEKTPSVTTDETEEDLSSMMIEVLPSPAAPEITEDNSSSVIEEAAEDNSFPVTEEVTEDNSSYVIEETAPAEESEYRSDIVETGTIEDEAVKKSGTERNLAAEAIIAKIQASIDSSFEDTDNQQEETTNSVNSDIDYTYSNTDTASFEQPATEESDSYSEGVINEKSESYSQYEEAEEQTTSVTESENADTADTQEAIDDDGFDDDEEDILPSAKEIGNVLSDLVDEDDENVPDDKNDDEAPVTKKSKGYLIAAFICAAVVLCCAGGLKLLRYYEIIPNYIFKIPEIIKQDIVNFPTLLEAAKEAESKVGYDLPDNFVLTDNNSFSASKNAVGETVCLAVTTSEGAHYLTGATLENGKVGKSFSFPSGMNNPSVEYQNGIFIVTGQVGDMTVIKFFDENTIASGESIYIYKQSGKLIGYYTDSNAFYVVTENFFNLIDARSEKLTSFIPYFEVDGQTSVVPFDKIVKPEIVAKTHYCTVSRLPYDLSATSVKTVLMGDAGGYCVSPFGLYTCDNIYLNEKYRARVCKIAFDKDMTIYSTDIDAALNPKMLISGKDSLLAVGITAENEVYSNAIYKFDATLSEPPCVLSPIAGTSSIEKAICGDEVLTLITSGDKALQYNINISDLSSAENGSTATSEKKINDELCASVSVNFNEEGKRTGIVLTVSGKDASASVIANVKDGTTSEWDAYIDSSMISNISELPYYESHDGVIIGLPVTFFDGISQVGEYRFYKYKSNTLKEIGRISLYDQKFSTVYCGFTSGDKPCILTLWDNKVITADIENIKIISESEIK